MTLMKAFNFPKPSKLLENGLLLPGPKAREYRSVQGLGMYSAQSCA